MAQETDSLSVNNLGSNLLKQDAIVWFGSDFSYDVSDNFTLELANQVRADNNWNDFKSYFFETSFNYKLSGTINDKRKAIAKQLDEEAEKFEHTIAIGGGYRYVFRDAFSQNSQRVFYVLSYKPYLGEKMEDKFSIGFRIKHQYDYVWNRTRDRHLIRGKVTFKFPFETRLHSNMYETKKKGKKIEGDFFIANEMFYRFYYKGDYWYRYRLQTGVNFGLPNWLIPSDNERSLALKYIFQVGLNDETELDHIFAFLYSVKFDWDKAIKKKKKSKSKKLKENTFDEGW